MLFIKLAAAAIFAPLFMSLVPFFVTIEQAVQLYPV